MSEVDVNNGLASVVQDHTSKISRLEQAMTDLADSTKRGFDDLRSGQTGIEKQVGELGRIMEGTRQASGKWAPRDMLSIGAIVVSALIGFAAIYIAPLQQAQALLKESSQAADAAVVKRLDDIDARGASSTRERMAVDEYRLGQLEAEVKELKAAKK